ncbi:MAG: UDP-N-acetylmuramate dehydrogenase [bacterium]|nr:UDP-N-acetylmuramate dehydrogenase [bacterium]
MFQENVLLSQYSSYRIGGPARYFQEIKTEEDLAAAIKEIRDLKIPFFVLGGGTNILFSDKGFDGAVLKISFKDIRLEKENEIIVGAGVLMADLLDFALKNNLSGLEWAGGLPGTVGGAVRGNAGAFAGETKDNVLEVISFEIETGKIYRRKKEDCRFGYRSSIFKDPPAGGRDGEIIIGARFLMVKGDKPEIETAIKEKINYRQERQPLEYPNSGSVFKNVDLQLIPKEHLEEVEAVIKKDPFPVVPTAFLISECGLKGMRIGGAMISPKHPNFLINYDKATAADVKALIALAKEKVYDKFGVKLEEEVLIF